MNMRSNAERIGIEQGSQSMKDHDVDQVEDAVLALMWLTAHDVDEHGARSWQGP